MCKLANCGIINYHFTNLSMWFTHYMICMIIKKEKKKEKTEIIKIPKRKIDISIR